MNRYQRMSKVGLSGAHCEDETIYFLNGGELKKPNIISRGKGRMVTVGSPPSALTSVLVPSLPDEDPDPSFPSFSPASTCVSQSIATPVVTPSIASDSITMAHMAEMTRMDEPEDVLVISDPSSLQVLDNGTVTYISSPVGQEELSYSQIPIPAEPIPTIKLDSATPDNSMTIQTDEGNLVLYLHEEGGDSSGAGTIEFGSDPQIIQTDAFPLLDNSGTVFPGAEGSGESYILVQIDDLGNTVLVPTSSFSNGGGGIHQNQSRQQNDDKSASGGKTRTAETEEERPKPFRYVLPDPEESIDEIGIPGDTESSMLNRYINILQSSNSNQLSIRESPGQLSCSKSVDPRPNPEAPPVPPVLVRKSTAAKLAPKPKKPREKKDKKPKKDPLAMEPIKVKKKSMRQETLEEGIIVTEKGTYVCKVCAKETKLEVQMVTHYNRVHKANRPHKCETCGLAFQFLSALKHHVKSHRDRYVCNQCDLVFQNTSEHFLHQKEVHGCILPLNYMISLGIDGTKYECESCSKIYMSRYNWMRHMLTHEPDNVPVRCQECSKEYPNKKFLINHIQAHQDPAKVFECDICAKNFKLKVHLTTHRKIHGPHGRPPPPPPSETQTKPAPVSPASETYPGKLKTKPVSALTKSLEAEKAAESTKPSSKFPCSVCGESFSESEAFDMHNVEKHTRRIKVAILRHSVEEADQASLPQDHVSVQVMEAKAGSPVKEKVAQVKTVKNIESVVTVPAPSVSMSSQESPDPDPDIQIKRKPGRPKKVRVPEETLSASSKAQEAVKRKKESSEVPIEPKVPKLTKPAPIETETEESGNNIRRSSRGQGKVSPVLEETKKKSSPRKESQSPGKKSKTPTPETPKPILPPQRRKSMVKEQEQLVGVELIEIKSGDSQPSPSNEGEDSNKNVRKNFERVRRQFRDLRAGHDPKDVEDSFFEVLKKVKRQGPPK